jgi:hypothetical protein
MSPNRGKPNENLVTFNKSKTNITIENTSSAAKVPSSIKDSRYMQRKTVIGLRCNQIQLDSDDNPIKSNGEEDDNVENNNLEELADRFKKRRTVVESKPALHNNDQI